MNRHHCDIHRVAGQCGIKLRDAVESSSNRRPRECFAKGTLRAIGREHGEAHLALVLRLIVETEGNAAELYSETITAVSRVVLSGLIEVGGTLFDAFDEIDLGQLRAWAQAVRGTASTGETMATALLWRLAGPDVLMPPPTAEERAAEQAAAEQRERDRRRREYRKRLDAA